VPGKKPLPPPPKNRISLAPKGVLELDQFSTTNLRQWKLLSEDLAELQRTLYFAVEPERRRLRPELIAALQSNRKNTGAGFSIKNWVRIVSYTYSLNPLSNAGSLRGIGGRFNAGIDLEPGTLAPWPALYMAENFETAFREKFQLKSQSVTDGLTPHELALTPSLSHVTVALDGQLSNLFDMTAVGAFDAVTKVLKRIRMPEKAKVLKKHLNMQRLSMVQSSQNLYDLMLKHNWRVLPAQFELPSESQIIADLIRAAGFEGIKYPSAMESGNCIVVFPDCLEESSFVSLKDAPPHPDTIPRLDFSTADQLAGWDTLPPPLRRR
jgi:hypothetical protein